MSWSRVFDACALSATERRLIHRIMVRVIVPSVHEDVHEWTRERQNKWRPLDYVHTVCDEHIRRSECRSRSTRVRFIGQFPPP